MKDKTERRVFAEQTILSRRRHGARPGVDQQTKHRGGVCVCGVEGRVDGEKWSKERSGGKGESRSQRVFFFLIKVCT